MKCSECKWWGRSIVGENFSQNNKKRGICDDPDSKSNYEFYVHQSMVKGRIPKGGWDFVIDFWTFEDFHCKSFTPKKDKDK